MRNFYKYIVIGCLFFACHLAVSSCFALTPKETMEGTVTEILTILDVGDTNDDVVWQQQREKVSVIVSDHFDMREMAKRSLAKYWKKRTPAEKDEFAALYSDLIKNTYIERLRSFSGSQDGTTFDKEVVRGTKSVVSSVVWQNNQELTVVYKMFKKADDWFVYDVIIEGVSLVRNYRSQFAQIIQKDGYEALVRKIQEKLLAPPIVGEHASIGE